MENNSIWAFNKPNDEAIQFIYQSLKEGISRFGWSQCDLQILKDKPDSICNKFELESWKKTRFLLEIKEGDWIIHINVPSYGMCVAAKVIEKYNYDPNDNQINTDYNPNGDFRNFFKIDLDSKIEFNRNDIDILPNISKRLKLQGHYWRIYNKDDFFKSIENLKLKNTSKSDNLNRGEYHLKQQINDILKKIPFLIHKNHPGKDLEGFIANIFRKFSNVINVIENGYGWRTDNGADLIVNYKTGFNIANLEKEEKLVIQIKSYENMFNDLNAIEQLKEAIKYYNANCGLLITTANMSEEIESKINKLSSDISVPIGIIAGEDLGKFVLKYYSDELIFNI